MDLMKGANTALMHKLAQGKGTEAFAMGPNEWAKNMMKKMGWTEGKGIGKKEDGIAEHIRVEKKDNNDGLGAIDIDIVNNPHCSIQHWSDTFNSVKVNIRCGSSDDDDDSASTDSSDSDSSEEMVSTTGAAATTNDMYKALYIACKGRRLGQRTHGVQKGKWQRTEGTDIPASPARPNVDAVQLPIAVSHTQSETTKKRKKKKKKRRGSSEPTQPSSERAAASPAITRINTVAKPIQDTRKRSKPEKGSLSTVGGSKTLKSEKKRLKKSRKREKKKKKKKKSKIMKKEKTS